MKPTALFERTFTASERRVFDRLRDPMEIQQHLDRVPYSTDPFNRCPRSVLRDRKANCFDGALFAAAALRWLGDPPRILDIFAHDDDDHLVALFQRHGRWGAIAKSNFSGLRYREPVYRTLRELVLSYFEGWFNVEGVRTMRSYTRPLDLRAYDRLNWMGSDEHMIWLADRTDRLHRIPLFSPATITAFSKVDPLSYRAGMLGVNPAGLYHPPRGSSPKKT